ncbi:hypothetical protein CLPUN_46020 [Clostridium puniceum]|uniref:Uncharacterized protein n=1 Tax=Clostridium puniceum TaxID=29367 RepID=A0A1S8T5H3_9CLOT|nr:hypothetical protein [Clostridium puniceum]OOM72899.1 hypothetical protein CLPUN_46020 [Clostridium puniceum]
MGNKVIQLNEEEQKNLFCAAWHLTNLIEDFKEDKIGNLATPCETCKYQKECDFDAYSYFQTLTKLTGVIVTPLLGARELARQGKFNLLKNGVEECNNGMQTCKR